MIAGHRPNVSFAGAGAHVVNLYHSGVSCGFSARRRVRRGDNAVKRGTVKGWSIASSRSNTRALMSINAHKLLKGRDGFAVTLTVGECPNTPADWAKMRNAYFRSLERRGCVAIHWLTEWQRRGVPHMHAFVLFDAAEKIRIQDVHNLWLRAARSVGGSVATDAQCVAPLTGVKGWLLYLSKHALRGYHEYADQRATRQRLAAGPCKPVPSQRSSALIPARWMEQTGRMWGWRGNLSVEPCKRVQVSAPSFFKLRRILRQSAKAQARAYKCPDDMRRRSIVKARTCLSRLKRDPTKERDVAAEINAITVRGMTRWIDPTRLLHAIGHKVDSAPARLYEFVNPDTGEYRVAGALG